MASWVGTGENLPIGADQIRQALGSEQVAAIAQEAGIPEEHASGGLAALLPEVVNHLTPDGRLPETCSRDSEACSASCLAEPTRITTIPESVP